MKALLNHGAAQARFGSLQALLWSTFKVFVQDLYGDCSKRQDCESVFGKLNRSETHHNDLADHLQKSLEVRSAVIETDEPLERIRRARYE